MYEYDSSWSLNGKGRLTMVDRYEPNGTLSSRIQAHFNAQGQPLRVDYTLDGLGGGGQRTYFYDYDRAGRPASMQYPTGETVRPSYDSAWRQTGLCSDWYGGYCYASNTQYTALDQPVSISLGNGVQHSYQYNNSMGRLSRLLVGPNGSGSIMDRSYSYDAVGNVSSITKQDAGYETQSFGYDSLDRLTRWTANNGQYNTNDQGYSFDLVGNITSKNGSVYNYDYSRGAGAGGPYAVRNPYYAYDPNGNMTNDPARNYAWSVENQPTQINKWPVSEQYRYDGNGERVRRVVSGGSSPGTTYYIGGMYEEEASGTRRVLYSLPGGGTAQRTLSSGNSSDTLVYLHADHLGSVSAATDSYGNVVSRQQYDPWGNSYNVQGATQSKVDYTGQRKDGTGLLYYIARYYDPGLGRFVSPDSIVPGASAALQTDFHEAAYKAEQKLTGKRNAQLGPKDPQQLSRYSYVGNNPLLYTDPTGHCLEVDDCTGKGSNRNSGQGGSSSGSWDDDCSGGRLPDGACGEAGKVYVCLPVMGCREATPYNDGLGTAPRIGGGPAASIYDGGSGLPMESPSGGGGGAGSNKFRGPAAKGFDWEHIYEDHTPNGARYDQSGKKTAWSSEEAARGSVTQAWSRRQKVETQNIPGQDARIRYRGVDNGGRVVEMWYNVRTGMVEAAYPVP